MSDAVRPPARRKHEHYFESDQWTVVDVDDVDRLFAAHTGDNEVRIDVDGTDDQSRLPQNDLIKTVKATIETHEGQSDDERASVSDVLDSLEDTVGRDRAEHAIEKLLKRGDLHEPESGRVETI